MAIYDVSNKAIKNRAFGAGLATSCSPFMAALGFLETSVPDEFDVSANAAWSALEPLRRRTEGNSYLEWKKLRVWNAPSTRFGSVICGIRIYRKRLLRKKYIGEILLIDDAWDHCWRVASWRKNYEPVIVFPADCAGVNIDVGAITSLRPNLEEAVSEISSMIEIIEYLQASDKLHIAYPPHWMGRSMKTVLLELFKHGTAIDKKDEA